MTQLPLLTAIAPPAGPHPQAVRALAAIAADRRGRLAIMLRAPALDLAGWQALLAVAASPIVAAGLQLAINVGPRLAPDQVRGFARLVAPWPFAWLQLGEQAARPERWRAALAELGQPRPTLCRSCHDRLGMLAAFADGADRVLLSPVWPTASKPEVAALGLHTLQRLAGEAPGPLIALGGIEAANVALTMAAGAAGVASLGAAWGPGGAALVEASLGHDSAA